MIRNFEMPQKTLIESYHRYPSYYDHKATAKPLEWHHFCFILNPNLLVQKAGTPRSGQTSIPSHRVEKVLTHSYFVVRKVGTNYKQYVHHIRLRPFSPDSPPDDFDEINPSNFKPDPSSLFTIRELEVFHPHFPALFIEDSVSLSPRSTIHPAATVIVIISSTSSGCASDITPGPS